MHGLHVFGSVNMPIMVSSAEFSKALIPSLVVSGSVPEGSLQTGLSEYGPGSVPEPGVDSSQVSGTMRGELRALGLKLNENNLCERVNSHAFGFVALPPSSCPPNLW